MNKKKFTIRWRILLGVSLSAIYFTADLDILALVTSIIIVIISAIHYWIEIKHPPRFTELISCLLKEVRSQLLLISGRVMKRIFPLSGKNPKEVSEKINPHIGFTALLLILLLMSSDGEEHKITWFLSPIQAYGAVIFSIISTGKMWEDFHKKESGSVDAQQFGISHIKGAISTTYGLLLVSIGFLADFFVRLYSISPFIVPEILDPISRILLLLFIYLSAGVKSTISTIVGAFQIALVLMIIVGLWISDINESLVAVTLFLVVGPLIIRTEFVWSRLFEVDD